MASVVSLHMIDHIRTGEEDGRGHFRWGSSTYTSSQLDKIKKCMHFYCFYFKSQIILKDQHKRKNEPAEKPLEEQVRTKERL